MEKCIYSNIQMLDVLIHAVLENSYMLSEDLPETLLCLVTRHVKTSLLLIAKLFCSAILSA